MFVLLNGKQPPTKSNLCNSAVGGLDILGTVETQVISHVKQLGLLNIGVGRTGRKSLQIRSKLRVVPSANWRYNSYLYSL